ncbi:protein translocase subunit SecF [Candidatus Micrarchaeota archaeon]|nr:protein translocase subunit SecF [Candidatus Micrarchaeota archaeon]MBU1939981.1 protein translocase subunit SecF [Candidatus Micrarchaeota archaeon]
MDFDKIDIYGTHYKKYIAIVAVLFLACLFIAFIYPGVQEGIDLRGGTLLIVRSDTLIDADSLEAALNAQFPLADVRISSISSPTGGAGTIIEFAENTELGAADKQLKSAKSLLASDPAAASAQAIAIMNSLSAYVPVPPTTNLEPEQILTLANDTLAKAKEVFEVRLQEFIRTEFSLGNEVAFQKREVGPVLGETFYASALTVGIIGFILVTIVIFAFFREFIPSVAVIAAAIFDISFALAAMAIFGIALSLSSIPALLMLIGYSVDTDIMLTTRLLKRREGSPKSRAMNSMKTGLTMTFTTLAALTAMLVLSYFGQILIVFEISAVLLFGLIGDLISTWLMNAPVLLWYAEKKEVHA